VQLEPLISFRATMVAHPIGATPHGHRLDMELAGQLLPGSRLSGRIARTNYLTLRPDGVAELDVRAMLKTDDDHVVSVRGSGLATTGDDGLASGTLALRFQTASETLVWLNQEVGIAGTRADMANGTLELTAYTITGGLTHSAPRPLSSGAPDSGRSRPRSPNAAVPTPHAARRHRPLLGAQAASVARLAPSLLPLRKHRLPPPTARQQAPPPSRR
jgi:hypothetical protein